MFDIALRLSDIGGMAENTFRRCAAGPFARAVVGVGLVLCAVAQAQNGVGDGPDRRETPVPAIATSLGTMPGVSDLPVCKELPEALVMQDGSRVATAEQWAKRRAEIKRLLEYYAVGAMPPAPGNVTGREILSQTVLDGAVKYRLVRLTFGPGEKLELSIGIFTPTEGSGPYPAVIMPGGTPPGATPLPTLPHPPGQGHGVDALLPVVESEAAPSEPPTAASGTRRAAANLPDAEAIAVRNRGLFQRGYALVTFNNNDCAEDTTLRNADGSWAFRTTRFYPAYPGYDWGVLAGWAWGVSRIVDYLETDPAIDKTKLIISGVSRTGKSAMIAAAFDERIAMAAPCVTGGDRLPIRLSPKETRPALH
jgi:Abhydrolase family